MSVASPPKTHLLFDATLHVLEPMLQPLLRVRVALLHPVQRLLERLVQHVALVLDGRKPPLQRAVLRVERAELLLEHEQARLDLAQRQLVLLVVLHLVSQVGDLGLGGGQRLRQRLVLRLDLGALLGAALLLRLELGVLFLEWFEANDE